MANSRSTFWFPVAYATVSSAGRRMRAFTTGAAYAGFAENEVGRLAPGMRADFVVLDADPLAVEPRAIPRIEVLSTWVDGQPVYERKAARNADVPH